MKKEKTLYYTVEVEPRDDCKDQLIHVYEINQNRPKLLYELVEPIEDEAEICIISYLFRKGFKEPKELIQL